ncbi:MAG: hypothetical protein BIFFINMI_02948 [Phycisphaerae bacterium]|nr:hypothetical protein [Phycisphaerae bacterium]
MASYKINKVMNEALKMPVADRALLAERLIRSLDKQQDTDVEAAWQEEIERRLRQIDSGSAELIPWEVVRDSLRKRLREPR